MDSFQGLAKSLCVGSPEDDRLGQLLFFYKGADIIPESQVVLVLISPGNDIVGSVFLVAGDEIRIVN